MFLCQLKLTVEKQLFPDRKNNIRIRLEVIIIAIAMQRKEKDNLSKIVKEILRICEQAWSIT